MASKTDGGGEKLLKHIQLQLGHRYKTTHTQHLQCPVTLPSSQITFIALPVVVGLYTLTQNNRKCSDCTLQHCVAAMKTTISCFCKIIFRIMGKTQK